MALGLLLEPVLADWPHIAAFAVQLVVAAVAPHFASVAVLELDVAVLPAAAVIDAVVQRTELAGEPAVAGLHTVGVVLVAAFAVQLVAADVETPPAEHVVVPAFEPVAGPVADAAAPVSAPVGRLAAAELEGSERTDRTAADCPCVGHMGWRHESDLQRSKETIRPRAIYDVVS